jgi:hypothetical protein
LQQVSGTWGNSSSSSRAWWTGEKKKRRPIINDHACMYAQQVKYHDFSKCWFPSCHSNFHDVGQGKMPQQL